MTAMKPQMQTQMGGAGMPELSEEELKKLAMLLQQMPANEGLATVTPGEESQMENVFKSGKALPGTQGLGPGGGLVQSFQQQSESEAAGQTSTPTAESTEKKEKQKEQKLVLGGKGPFEWGNVPKYIKQKADEWGIQYGASESKGEDQGQFETRPEVIQARETKAGSAEGKGLGSDGVPVHKFKDMNGNWFNTQAEADASNAKIKTGMSGIEKQVLTTDSTYERWSARNKDNPAFAGLSEDQKKTAYNTALTKSQEDASAQVPKMVETMNNYFAGENIDENATYEEFAASVGAAMPANLSEATMRDMYENARKKFQRGEAFTLTPEEVAEFEREAIQTATVDDADKLDLGEVADAEMTDVGEVADVTPTEVAAIASVTDQDVDAIFEGGIDKAEELLMARIDGTADSPAERQLMRSSEQNLRMLLGATAGGDANPAKVRQLKNIWADQTQFAIGEAADLRSKESLDAEAKLVDLYKNKDTLKLNTKLANMEKEKQRALKNGDLALARKLANQGTMLQRVITKASIEKDTKLANLEKAKNLAIEQGKTDLAVNIANLQKNLTIAKVDAELAVEQRSMDDAIAMNAYKGQQALYGLEAELDMDQAKNDLTLMGFDLQRDLAELDSATQLKVAEMTKQWREAQGDDAKQAAIIGAMGTVLASFAKSDIRAKTNISPGAGGIESFLDALNEYKYEYKDPHGDQAGMFVGVMAQDLEKTPMGASFVKDTPRGKMVDYGHGLAAILASQANIHDRLRFLEEG